MANFNIDYLVVAGGGGGGYLGGGGGAGGYRTSFGTGNINGGQTAVESSLTLTTSAQYTVSVGAGGIGGNSENSYADSGVASSLSGTGITTVTSTGGGGGGNVCYGGNTGASGGGASSCSASNAGGIRVTNPIQGFAGGANQTSGVYPAGGGGGAFSAGLNNANGGTAMASSITGTSTYYAGGGGGGTRTPNGATSGGTGGGGGAGNGTNTNLTGGNATANTGSGGGGGGLSSGSIFGAGGNGGSGIVILRYPTADVASYTATGLTPTQTTNGTDTILSFTTVGTGTITFTPPPPPTPFDGTRATTPVTGFNKTGTSEGLKLPSGDNSNQPVGALAEQGMIRNDTEETVDSSASAIAHYNGTNWQYFAATESPDVPLILSSVMYYSASDTTSYPGSGTDWFDLSGNSNTATITSSNYSNGYFDLTPTASIITTPVNTLYQTFSYSIWVKFDSVTVASGYALNVLSKSQFYASNHDAFPFFASVGPTGTFTNNLSYGNDYSPDVTNSTSVSANTWYNIACVIDTTTNTSKLYIGTESNQLALVNSVSYTGTLVSSPNQFYSLGKAPAEYGGGVGKSSMNGKIAKFGFWDTALTEAELITIWGLGSGAS